MGTSQNGQNKLTCVTREPDAFLNDSKDVKSDLNFQID